MREIEGTKNEFSRENREFSREKYELAREIEKGFIVIRTD